MLGSDASDGGGSTRSSFGIDRLSRQDSVFSSFRTLVNDARIHLTLVVHPRKVCPLLSPLQHYTSTYEHTHALFCTVNTVSMRVKCCSLFQCAAQEEDGFLSMNSLYGSVRLSQDSDNVLILQDQELMNEMRSHDPNNAYSRDRVGQASYSSASPYQNPTKFIQAS